MKCAIFVLATLGFIPLVSLIPLERPVDQGWNEYEKMVMNALNKGDPTSFTENPSSKPAKASFEKRNVEISASEVKLQRKWKEYEEMVLNALEKGDSDILTDFMINDTNRVTVAKRSMHQNDITVNPNDPLYQFGKRNFYYSAAAYCNSKSNMMNWDCGKYCDEAPKGTKLITRLHSDDIWTEGFVAVNSIDKQIIVSFKGSSNWKDWVITNFKTSHTTLNSIPNIPQNVRVHSGFLRSVQSVLPLLVNTTKSLLTEYPEYPIVFIGHSLGGALATLGALHVQKLVLGDKATPEKLQVITYGQPRIGNEELSRYIQSAGIPVTRFVSNYDVVPHVPPTFMGYYHHLREHWIKKDNIHYCSDHIMIEDPECSTSVSPTLWSILDHIFYFGVYINLFACKA